MKGVELQCSPLKPPFKIPADLLHPPFVLYLPSYLYPYLSYLSSSFTISYLRSKAVYPNHVERDRYPHRRIFPSSPLPTSFSRTQRFHPAVSASPFLECSQERQRRTRDPSWGRDADDRWGGKFFFFYLDPRQIVWLIFKIKTWLIRLTHAWKKKNLLYFLGIFLLSRLMLPYVGKQKLGC